MILAFITRTFDFIRAILGIIFCFGFGTIIFKVFNDSFFWLMGIFFYGIGFVGAVNMLQVLHVPGVIQGFIYLLVIILGISKLANS